MPKCEGNRCVVNELKEKSDERPEEAVVVRGEGAVTVEKWLILPWEMVP